MPKKKSSVATIGLGYRLSSHEKLCAERMKLLQKSIDEIKRDVSSLKDKVSKGSGAVAVLMTLGAFIIGVLSYFNFK